MEFKDYWMVLVRRKWLVVLPVAASIALAITLNTITEPVYRATARIEIQREPTRSVLTGAEIDNRGFQLDNMTLFTTAQMITNRDLLGRVVVALRGRNGAIESGVSQLDIERQVDWLSHRLTVEPIRDTRLVNIHVEHASGKRAAEIADLVAWYFEEYQAHQKAEGNATLVSYLNDQVMQTKEKIQRSEQGLLSAGQADPYTLEQRLKQLSETIAEQQKSLVASNRELAGAREIYLERHPRRIALETENETIRENIASNQAEMKAINDNLQRYSVAQSELKSDRDLLAMLLAKLQEAEINGKVQNSLVQLVQPATPTREPVRPRKALNVVVCVLAGVLGGVGLAFLREYLRRTIRTPDDVTDHPSFPSSD
jgi:uncharacterized protein involved in exopolysaccharide biosynthesis